MADPISVALVSAFVAGAVKGVAKGSARVGESALVDAYAALRHLVTTGYAAATDLLASIASVEAKPDSKGRQETLAEELRSSGALTDARLLAAAEAVLKAAEPLGPTIGVNWQDVQAAQIEISKIRARAGSEGMRAVNVRATGTIKINEIDAGGTGGN